MKFLERNFEESELRFLSRVDDAVHVGHAVRCLPWQAVASGIAGRKVGGWSIADFTALSLSARAACGGQNSCAADVDAKTNSPARPLEEVAERLDFLLAVGLGYLSLDRSAATLSGGEAQRIRLATQIGSRLRGVLYVLDEPSIGLHARDNDRLLGSLEQLRNLGNTVLVVEHDEETIRRADFVVDLGPGAGNAGGYLVAQGKPEQIAATAESLTGQYLSGAAKIAVPAGAAARTASRSKFSAPPRII